MKPQLQDKDVLAVHETVEHFKLSHKKFYALLKEEGLLFVAFYYNEHRLILRSEFVKYLAGYPKIRRREPK